MHSAEHRVGKSRARAILNHTHRSTSGAVSRAVTGVTPKWNKEAIQTRTCGPHTKRDAFARLAQILHFAKSASFRMTMGGYQGPPIRGPRRNLFTCTL